MIEHLFDYATRSIAQQHGRLPRLKCRGTRLPHPPHLRRRPDAGRRADRHREPPDPRPPPGGPGGRGERRLTHQPWSPGTRPGATRRRPAPCPVADQVGRLVSGRTAKRRTLPHLGATGSCHVRSRIRRADSRPPRSPSGRDLEEMLHGTESQRPDRRRPAGGVPHGFRGVAVLPHVAGRRLIRTIGRNR